MLATVNKPDRLYLFSLLWAIANLFHPLAHINVLKHPLGFLNFLFAVLLLFRPKSILFLMLMLTFSIAKTYRAIPFTSNHLLIDFAVNIAILLTVVIALIPVVSKQGVLAAFKNLDREKLYNTFAPVARINLLVLYFFAVLHKLNWDYFNPVVSCATWYLTIFRNNGITIIPENDFIGTASIYGSLLIEGGILVLLFFRRTRTWGILLGLGFHFFLSLEPQEGMISFVIMLFSLFFLFTPVDFPDKVMTVVRGLLNREKIYLRIFVPLAFVAVITVITILFAVAYSPVIRYIPFTLWYVYASFLIVLFLTVILTQHIKHATIGEYFGIKKIGLALIPVLLFINGLSPYLGLKTQLSFSMFSNLRTEGGRSNHLFIPNSFHLTSWQQDLVEITDTNLDKLSDNIEKKRLITFFELKRVASDAAKKKEFYVKYIRNQKQYILTYKNGVSSDPELTTPHPWALSKLVRFRGVDKGLCLCKH